MCHGKASKKSLSHLNLEVNTEQPEVLEMEVLEMVDHLDSTNLVPFKRRRNEYHLPGLQKQAEEQVIDEVDPELRPEEQGFVRHYLGYADVLLKNSAPENDPELDASSDAKDNMTEMPARERKAA